MSEHMTKQMQNVMNGQQRYAAALAQSQMVCVVCCHPTNPQVSVERNGKRVCMPCEQVIQVAKSVGVI